MPLPEAFRRDAALSVLCGCRTTEEVLSSVQRCAQDVLRWPGRCSAEEFRDARAVALALQQEPEAVRAEIERLLKEL